MSAHPPFDSVEKPLLAFNTLQTETEKSEHKGFAQLLKGCLAAIRNPIAHGPKILWQGETDAADYLTLISIDKNRLLPELLLMQS
jgi:uncharacterized protein (TIGR02391 family)